MPGDPSLFQEGLEAPLQYVFAMVLQGPSSEDTATSLVNENSSGTWGKALSISLGNPHLQMLISSANAVFCTIH